MDDFNRNKKPFQGRDFSRDGYRPMCDAICGNCGKSCKVPFRPTNGKPVYCSACFGRMKNSKTANPDQNINQLDVLNAKLDEILSILKSKKEASAIKEPANK